MSRLFQRPLNVKASAGRFGNAAYLPTERGYEKTEKSGRVCTRKRVWVSMHVAII
jgi:hypothetical protein